MSGKRFGIIRQAVGEKSQHDRAQRVNIHAGISLASAKIARFWRHESWRSNQGTSALVGIHWIERGARNSKINHFHNGLIGVK